MNDEKEPTISTDDQTLDAAPAKAKGRPKGKSNKGSDGDTPDDTQRVRRVFQCGNPGTAPSQIVTYTAQPRVDANGFKYGATTRVINRNAAYQFILPANAPFYEEQLATMRAMSVKTRGEIQEVGLDTENKVPRDASAKSPEKMAQELKTLEAEKSTIDLRLGKLIEEKGEQETELDALRKQNEALKKNLEDLVGR